MAIAFDEFDLKIIRKLDQDGRIPYSQIAEDLGISNTMVHKRVAKLLEKGVIQHISPVFEERLLGYGYGTFTGIVVDKESRTQEVIENLRKIPEVTACHYIVGPYSLYIRIFAKDQEDLRRILYDEIDNIDGVLRTESMIDLGCAFKRNILFQ